MTNIAAFASVEKHPLCGEMESAADTQAQARYTIFFMNLVRIIIDNFVMILIHIQRDASLVIQVPQGYIFEIYEMKDSSISLGKNGQSRIPRA